MWILIEFAPDLALRNISFFNSWERKIEECVPEKLEVWKVYEFLKEGQKNYYLLEDEPIPFRETKWNSILSRPLAAVRILEATHFLNNWKIFTRWKYKVLEIFDINSPEIHFEWFNSIKK